MWVRTGVQRDGAITAMHFKSFIDGGGYSSYGVATTRTILGRCQTLTYHIPAYRFEGLRVLPTNRRAAQTWTWDTTAALCAGSTPRQNCRGSGPQRCRHPSAIRGQAILQDGQSSAGDELRPRRVYRCGGQTLCIPRQGW